MTCYIWFPNDRAKPELEALLLFMRNHDEFNEFADTELWPDQLIHEAAEESRANFNDQLFGHCCSIYGVAPDQVEEYLEANREIIDAVWFGSNNRVCCKDMDAELLGEFTPTESDY